VLNHKKINKAGLQNFASADTHVLGLYDSQPFRRQAPTLQQIFSLRLSARD